MERQPRAVDAVDDSGQHVDAVHHLGLWVDVRRADLAVDEQAEVWVVELDDIDPLVRKGYELLT